MYYRKETIQFRADSSMLVLEDSDVQSSAYVISLMPSGGSGNRDMYRLNNVGNNTTCLTLLYLELMFLNVTYVCLPYR